MDEEELLYQIALTFVEGVGNITARKLLTLEPSVKELFLNIKEISQKVNGFSANLLKSFQSGLPLKRAETELSFIKKNKIKGIFFSDELYPSRLREIDDAPMMLYTMGEGGLNLSHVVSIVGTRHATDYGVALTDRLVSDLATYSKNITIVSGLAYGIDIASHRSALKNGLPTYAVLAHGLDRIYPFNHKSTAVKMLQEGGLLSEFPSGVEPERYNFIARNRIIAGLAEVVVVVESAERGGALITADIANSYSIEVATFPGRATDTYSMGCNQLIRNHKASLITSAEDLLKLMNWDSSFENKEKARQLPLFQDLSSEERGLVEQFKQGESYSVEDLSLALHAPIAHISSLLTELEFKGILASLPGNRYRRI